MSYNLDGVEDLQLSAATLAKIFQAEITTWDDSAIAADNPDAELPSTPIVVVHRSDGSGTTNNFTKFLKSGGRGHLEARLGRHGELAGRHPGRGEELGRRPADQPTAGAIGYVDLADAAKADLAFAAIQDQTGEFVLPSADGVTAALEKAEVAEDLTYNPLNSSGEGVYPITAPTWLITYASYSDAATVTSLQTYLRYVLTTGQEQASSTGYVGIPESLQSKALAQVDEITAG